MMLRNRKERPGSVPIVSCGIGEREFALELSAVAGVRVSPVRPADARDLDGTSIKPASERRVDRITGSRTTPEVLVASQLIPARSVVSLAPLLGLPATRPQGVEQIVILRGPRGLWGLRVARVSRVSQKRLDAFLPVPGVMANAITCPFKRLILASTESEPGSRR